LSHAAASAPAGRGLNVHLYPSPLTHEMRMEKLAASIADTGAFLRIELVGLPGTGLPDLEERSGYGLRRIPRWEPGGPRLLRKAVATLDWSRRVFLRYARADLACVNSHSLAVLPLGLLLKFATGARLVYDTHELETEVSTSRGLGRVVYKLLEAALIRFADETVVVSDSIADWYRDTYGLRRPWVVRNVPEVPPGGLPAPAPRLWRDRFGIPDDHLVFIYQGGLFRGRRIEQFLRVFAAAKPDRHVVFMGYGDLEDLVKDAAARHPNIHFAPAVKPRDVLSHTAGADVGLVGVENICFSYYFSLPNKLFEYFMAGVPALMPDYPEMARVLRSERIGWLAGESDETWLEAIGGINHDALAQCRARVRESAGRTSWSAEVGPLCDAYASDFGRREVGA
jgi:glycosyltransferase involved in cell wall biosynthesis